MRYLTSPHLTCHLDPSTWRPATTLLVRPPGCDGDEYLAACQTCGATETGALVAGRVWVREHRCPAGPDVVPDIGPTAHALPAGTSHDDLIHRLRIAEREGRYGEAADRD